MARLKHGLRVASICLFLALAGCGDGGGVASTPPPVTVSDPVPSPVTPASLSPSAAFTNAMQSGGFVTLSQSDQFTDAVTGSDASGNNIHSYKHDYAIAAKAFVSYDLASNTYTLNYTKKDNTAGTTSFAPLTAQDGPNVTIVANGVPDPTEVNTGKFICYTSGCYGNDVYVTHTGSGPFVYSYTAFASAGTNSISLAVGGGGYTIYQAVFGMPTPNVAVPRTGSANYTLDLLGRVGGTGTGKVDFGAGTYNFSGTLKGSSSSSPDATTTFSGTFDSTGTLTSGANGFGGFINVSTKYVVVGSATVTSLTETTAYRGELTGLFFGPQAQELGGLFNAPATSHTSTNPAAIPTSPAGVTPFSGAILGHK